MEYDLPKRSKAQKVGTQGQVDFYGQMNPFFILTQTYQDSDYGIDFMSQLEIDNQVTGNYANFQIKSSEDKCSETKDYFSIKIKRKTIELWRQSDPAFLVFFDTKNKIGYWVYVNPIINENYSLLKKTFTFRVYKKNLLIINNDLNEILKNIILEQNKKRLSTEPALIYLEFQDISLDYKEITNRNIETAKKAFKSKEYDKAKKLYDKIIKTSKLSKKHTFNCFNNLAACYLELNNLEQAFNYLNKCLKFGLRKRLILSNLSQICVKISETKKQFLKKARDYAVMALKLDKKDILANITLSGINNNYSNLLPLLKLEMKDELKAFLNYSIAYIKDNKNEKDSFEYAEKALSIDKDNHGFNSFLGCLHLKRTNTPLTGNLDEIRKNIKIDDVTKAIKYYKKSLELMKKQGLNKAQMETTRNNLLTVYSLICLYDPLNVKSYKSKVIAIYNSLLKKDYYAHLNLANIYLLDKDFDSALKILNLLPEDNIVLPNKLKCYVSQKNYVTALKKINENFERFEDDEEIMKLHSWLTSKIK